MVSQATKALTGLSWISKAMTITFAKLLWTELRGEIPNPKVSNVVITNKRLPSPSIGKATGSPSRGCLAVAVVVAKTRHQTKWGTHYGCRYLSWRFSRSGAQHHAAINSSTITSLNRRKSPVVTVRQWVHHAALCLVLTEPLEAEEMSVSRNSLKLAKSTLEMYYVTNQDQWSYHIWFLDGLG